MSQTNKLQQHVMIDIETAGTAPGSAILQIGATVFSCNSEEPLAIPNFYASISLDSCLAAGLTTDPATLAWWDKQDQGIRARVFGSNQKLADVLDAFYLWFYQSPATSIVWGNGANFDITLLECAFKSCKVPIPWHYRNVRCYRTVTAMFPLPQQFTVPSNPQKHTALADACYQANVLIATASYLEETSDGLLRIL